MPGVYEDRGGTVTNYHSGIKNTFLQTNAAGSQTAAKRYDAFGNVLASSGTWQGRFAYGGPHGYQTDGSLQLLGDRYYDPSLGRFLTRDTAKDGRNWYVYCGNNPLKYADPSGFGLSINSPEGVLVLGEMLEEEYAELMALLDPELLKLLLLLIGVDGVIWLLNAGLIPVGRYHGIENKWGKSWAFGSAALDRHARDHYDIPNRNPCTYVTIGQLSLMDFIAGRAKLKVAQSLNGSPLGNGYWEIVINSPQVTVKDPWTVPVPPGYLAPKSWPDGVKSVRQAA
jgi:RHS repeat-associated protein